LLYFSLFLIFLPFKKKEAIGLPLFFFLYPFPRPMGGYLVDLADGAFGVWVMECK